MIDRVFRSFLQLDLSNPSVNPTAKVNDINSLLSVVVGTATVIAALVFGAMLIMAGFQIVTSAGDPEKMQKAQQTGTYAVIGILIIICAYLIVRVLAFVFGLELPF